MNTMEDKVRLALRETGEEIGPHSVPPLRLPGTRRTRLPRIPGRWGTRLAPLAAAAAVAAVVAASLAISTTFHGHARSTGQAAAPRWNGSPIGPASALHKVPPYFVVLPPQALIYARTAQVRSTVTGHVLATFSPPRPYKVFTWVSGTADDRTFVLAAQRWWNISSGQAGARRPGPGQQRADGVLPADLHPAHPLRSAHQADRPGEDPRNESRRGGESPPTAPGSPWTSATPSRSSRWPPAPCAPGPGRGAGSATGSATGSPWARSSPGPRMAVIWSSSSGAAPTTPCTSASWTPPPPAPRSPRPGSSWRTRTGPAPTPTRPAIRSSPRTAPGSSPRPASSRGSGHLARRLRPDRRVLHPHRQAPVPRGPVQRLDRLPGGPLVQPGRQRAGHQRSAGRKGPVRRPVQHPRRPCREQVHADPARRLQRPLLRLVADPSPPTAVRARIGRQA